MGSEAGYLLAALGEGGGVSTVPLFVSCIENFFFGEGPFYPVLLSGRRGG